MTVTGTVLNEVLQRTLQLKITGAPTKHLWKGAGRNVHYQPDTVILRWVRDDRGWRRGHADVRGVGTAPAMWVGVPVFEGFAHNDPAPEWLQALILEHAPKDPS